MRHFILPTSYNLEVLRGSNLAMTLMHASCKPGSVLDWRNHHARTEISCVKDLVICVFSLKKERDLAGLFIWISRCYGRSNIHLILRQDNQVADGDMARLAQHVEQGLGAVFRGQVRALAGGDPA